MSLLGRLKTFFAPKPPAFTVRVQAQLAQRPEAERAHWAALLEHCEKPRRAAVPSANWTRAARQCFDAVGGAAYVTAMKAWFSPEHRAGFERAGFVKGLVWCSTFADDQGLSVLLGDLGIAAYAKGEAFQGPVDLSVGNACAWALGASTAAHAHAQLARLKEGTRYRNARAQVDKAANRAAKARSVGRDELDELVAPSFEGTLPAKLGAWSPQLRFEAGVPTLAWVREDGKEVEAVPAEVKRAHADALAALKKQLKAMKALLPAHVARLEALFVTDRALTVAQWTKHYVEHGLVGFLARPLVWRFGDVPGVWMDGEVLGADGARLTVPSDAEVRLWHPAGRAPEEVEALRALMAKLKRAPPFEQVDRATFALTEREHLGGSSARWSNRRLRQQRFFALARELGWRYRLISHDFDSLNVPSKDLPDWNLRLELTLNTPDADEVPSGMLMYVTTGHLHVRRGTKAVPPMVISELLREVDRLTTAPVA